MGTLEFASSVEFWILAGIVVAWVYIIEPIWRNIKDRWKI